MVKPLQPSNHVEQASEHLLSQYNDSKSFQDYIASHVEPLNDLEVDFESFKTQLPLAVAAGRNLDYWGDILQAPTRPVNDDTFRTLLYALIAAYNSKGTAESVNSVFDLIVKADETSIRELGNASFSVYIANPKADFDVDFFFLAINLAKSIGTEFVGLTVSQGGLLPILSFDTDNRANSQGGFFSLAAIQSSSFFQTYEFAALGTLSTTDRILPTQSASAPEETPTIRLKFFVSVDIADDFQAELNSVLGVEGGTLVVYDRNGTRWSFIAGQGGIPITRNNPAPDWSALNVEVILLGNDTCAVFQDGQRVRTDSILNGDEDVNNGDPFQSYDDNQGSIYNNLNPDGLGSAEEIVSDDQGGYYSQFFGEQNVATPSTISF